MIRDSLKATHSHWYFKEFVLSCGVFLNGETVHHQVNAVLLQERFRDNQWARTNDLIDVAERFQHSHAIPLTSRPHRRRP